MRVMILGAGGMLAHDLIDTAPSDAILFRFTKRDLNITDSRSIESQIATIRPNVIVNGAAFSAVDRAETEKDAAFQVNGIAVGALGEIAKRFGARVVHYSTDYVFDGAASVPYKETSPTNPINVYGASKLSGEIALSQSGANFLLIRSQWLFGRHGRCFPKTMHERALAGLVTRVVMDQTGRPTHTRDLAQAMWSLLGREAMGVFHFANEGQVTWFDVASRIFARAGRSHLLKACTTAEYLTPARRPKYSVLDTTSIQRILGSPINRYETCLDDFLDSI